MMQTTHYSTNASPAGTRLMAEYRKQAGTMTNGAERRAARRYQAQPGGTIYYIEGAGAIRDLSTDGIFVLDAEPLEVGTAITFSIYLGKENVKFQGIVRRSVPEEGMAIQFTDVSRELRRRLVSSIACLS